MIGLHSKIQRQIYEEIVTISDQELFASEEFQEYLLHFAEALTKRYGRNINVKTFWHEKEKFCADTDSQSIRINCANEITTSMPNRVLMADSLIGLLSHEVAHILFTDFDKVNFVGQNVLLGHLYPDKPELYSEMKDFIINGGNKERQAFWNCVFTFINIIEDAYIESCMCYAYRGSVTYCLQLVNSKIMNNTLSILEQIRQGYSGYVIMSNLILQYCLSGSINNAGNYEGEYTELLYQCIPILDEAIYEENTLARIGAAYDLMGILWKFTKELINQYLEHADNDSCQANMLLQQQNLNNQSQDNSEQQEASTQTGKKLEQLLQEQVHITPFPNRKGNAVQEQLSSLKADAEKRQIESLIDKGIQKTDYISTGKKGRIIKDYLYKSSNNFSTVSECENILKKIGERKAVQTIEVHLKDELQDLSKQIYVDNVHKKFDLIIHRLVQVPTSYDTQYGAIAEPFEQIGIRTAKLLEQTLKKQKQTGKMSGFYTGKNFVLKHYSRMMAKFSIKIGCRYNRI